MISNVHYLLRLSSPLMDESNDNTAVRQADTYVNVG
jgi:hypothetical protein